MTESTRVLVDILAAVLSTVSAGAGGYLVALIRRHVSAKTLDLAEDLARSAADAAWAVAERDGLDKTSVETAALQQIEALAARHHLALSDAEWRTLINAALTYRYGDERRDTQINLPAAAAIHVTTSAAEPATASAGGAG